MYYFGFSNNVGRDPLLILPFMISFARKTTIYDFDPRPLLFLLSRKWPFCALRDSSPHYCCSNPWLVHLHYSHFLQSTQLCKIATALIFALVSSPPGKKQKPFWIPSKHSLILFDSCIFRFGFTVLKVVRFDSGREN